jgi:tRNA threonylcarbamoyladenosine biosynthesis protein TsaB
MNLLAIDSSSRNISIGLEYEGKTIADINQKRLHGASLIIEHIDKCLKKRSLSLKAFDAFVIGGGPGSFTGLRISFSLIKAFGLALKKPVISLGSFLSCAYVLRNKSARIAVISDARRNLIYAASYKVNKGVLRPDAKARLLSLDEFVKLKKDYLFLTFDSHLRSQVLKDYPQINFYPRDVYPKAANLLPFARICYNNRKFTLLDKLKPLYLYPKTCQIQKK